MNAVQITPPVKSRKRLYVASFLVVISATSQTAPLKNATSQKQVRINKFKVRDDRPDANLLYVSTGCVMAWPSPSLPKLVGSGVMTEEEGDWAASLYGLGAAFGPALTAVGVVVLGRKWTLVASAGAFILSWILIGAAGSSSIPTVYLGRVVGGVGVGACFAGVSVYVAEITDDEVRGAVGSVSQMFVGLGFLIEYCVGPYVSYTTLAVISACAALAFAVPFFLMPESPHYLIAKTRRKEAVEALRWLRGNVPPHAVEREISSIEDDLQIATSKKPTGHLGGCLELVTRRGPCRALLLCLYLMFCQQLSGINAIISFSQPIFLAAHMSLSSSISPMLVGAVNCISSCFTPPLVRRFGIKNTLIGSGVGMGLCNILLSVYFYLLNSNQNVDSISVLPVICLMAYNIFFCLGIGPLPWTVAAEMFPVHLKGLANSVIGAFAWLLAFGVMRSYNSAVLALGSFGIFLLYGLLLIVGMVGTFFMLPDTRGLSLQDIQDLMDGRKSQELSSVDNFGYF